MCPLKLAMTYFGPYPQATIDFTKFAGTPLYLIAGKTGAGKTTIFDALCFALFGRTTNDGRDARSLRSDFAPATAETKVVLDFEHAGVTYRIERQPGQTVMGRGHKLVERGAKATLTYPLGATTPQAITKIKPVDQFIEDLLHLDVTQFRQIVLLPQGKFRDFLMANSKEKETILRSLFATERYQAWGDELARQQKALGADLQTKADQLTALRQQVTTLDATQPVDRWLTDAQTQVQAGQAAQKEISREIATAAAAASAATTADTAAHRLASDQAELADHEATAADLASQAPAMATLSQEVATLKWVHPYQPDYHDWEQATHEQAQLTAQLATNQQAQTSQAAAVASAAATVASLTAQQATMDQQRDLGRTLATQLPRFQRVAELSRNLRAAQETVQTAETAVTKVQTKLAQAQAQLTSLNQAAAVAPDLSQTAVALAKQASQLKQWQTELAQLTDRQATIEHLRQQDAQLARAHQTAQARAEQAAVTYQAQDQAYLRATIARLYDQLEPGSPCPVCGAVEHPRQHRPVGADPTVTATTVKEARQARDQAQAAANRLASDQAAHHDHLVNLQEQLAQDQTQLAQALPGPASTDLGQLKGRLAQVRERLQQAQDRLAQDRQGAKERAAALEASRAAIEAGQQALSQAKGQQQAALLTQQTIQSELKVTQAQLPTSTADLATIKERIQAIHQTVGVYQKQVTAAQQTLQAARERTVALDERAAAWQAQQAQAMKRAAQKKQQLQAALAARGAEWDFWAQTWPRLARLPKLEAQLADYRQAVKVNQANLDRLRQRIAGRPAPDLQATQARRETTAAALAKLQNQAGRAAENLAQLTKTTTAVAQLYHDQQVQLQDYDRLSQLAMTMNGKGATKLGLERYVQRAYFQKVLDQANPRLSQLTAGRYQFVLDHQLNPGRGTRSGLEVNIYDDHVGKERSAHTLSGGEGFMASLALALALGEVVQQEQGGVHIDTLFVDEGFGSLDTAALDAALTALQSIRGYRMIGIISHVKELEERIPNQLLVHTIAGRSRISYRTDI